MSPSSHGAALLSRAYEDLDFDAGDLLDTSVSVRRGHFAEWQAVGEWLMLAERMGAERVFFVGDDPVIIFARLPEGSDETDVLTAYRRAWSLARPRCLFLATEDELRVFALSRPPTSSSSKGDRLEPLEVVNRAADVAEQLAAYHRERVESGALFEDPAYRDLDGRADFRLLHDVRVVTAALEDAGLSRQTAHALVERVILIRYLEDRGVITREYFEEIGETHAAWSAVLAKQDERPSVGAHSSFITLLTNESLVYAVFERLERDFNGDLFLVSNDERAQVTQKHLVLIQRLLSGEGLSEQQPLFLWAYDFSVVPTGLISSMYEQFYRSGTDDDSGTHYTPPELVEFVLGQTMTEEILGRNPRVCDPACGSGIFLVEAFRRIVRYEMTRQGRRLSPRQLSVILVNRIAGIDLNAEAIRLAAFSLYLAFLNYQTPQDIRSAGPLPRLIYRAEDQSQPAVLVVADAFAATTTEPVAELTVGRLPWPNEAFDVVVGNPPWDEPSGSTSRIGDAWAHRARLPVGDRNPSQLFLWRTLSFLRPDGVAALLVGATAFHNTRSKQFRAAWLRRVRLHLVVNFTPARNLFFSGAIAPFLLVKFAHAGTDAIPPFVYRTVRPGAALANTRSLGFARADRRWIDQEALRHRDYLWKTYAWGNHHDASFMARLDAEERLADHTAVARPSAYGYQRGTNRPSERLAALPSLKRFEIFGSIEDALFEEPPRGVKRQPDERLYAGQRLIVTRGIRSKFGPVARLENSEFSFRHTIYCVPLVGVRQWKAKSILGILLSSLGRYRIFMTSGSWGIWHDSVVPEDILSLPVRLPGASSPEIRRIVRAVDRLRALRPSSNPPANLFHTAAGGGRDLQGVTRELDEAVFDLFDLTDAERDLVNDFHRYTLDTVGRRSGWAPDVVRSTTRSVGTLNDVALAAPADFHDYLLTFLRTWNRELAPDGEFGWQLVSSYRSSMVAMVFETKLRSHPAPLVDDGEDWAGLLQRLGDVQSRHLSKSIRLDGSIRIVTDTSVIVVKNNEARRWTASAAREDAEATMLQAMALRS
jgi:hypothetical protein